MQKITAANQKKAVEIEVDAESTANEILEAFKRRLRSRRLRQGRPPQDFV
jgi:vacuolar-type H+-ATPase subunit E/Vma4